MLSDFSDSEPGRTLNGQDFNPRLISAFAAMYPATYPGGVPGSTISAQASYIVANDFNRWVDFNCYNYARFFNALATNLGGATGRIGLVADQGNNTTAYRRLAAIDGRIIATNMSPHSFVCIWDNQIIQVGRAGPLVLPLMTELTGATLSAAREPLLRYGGNIEADDSAYWSAVESFYPSLSSADQTEIGYKMLKRLWLWQSWAHIADRQGNVRRACAFMCRDYWDVGSLTATNLGPLQNLIQTVVPTRPIGVAVYYSEPLERLIEAQQGAAAGASIYGPATLYMSFTDLQGFLDSGTAAGYYVSDVALPKISKGSTNAPSAWMVIDPTGQLSASENSALSAIAPVVKSPAALAALSDQPLVFTGGVAGFGFYDQWGRLILVASNPSVQTTAATITGTIELSGLTNGLYTISNLFSGVASSGTASGGTLNLPVSVTRWDTLVYAVTPGPPAVTNAPLSQTNYLGTTVSFSLQAASSLPVSYQWFFGATQLVGQTNATLVLTNIQPGEAGLYSITVNNLAGVTNATAKLTVVAPPSIHQSLVLPQGQFQSQASAIPGTTGSVLYGTNVNGPWFMLANITAGANGTATFMDTNSPLPARRFYRLSFP
jgi:hypothetical protein